MSFTLIIGLSPSLKLVLAVKPATLLVKKLFYSNTNCMPFQVACVERIGLLNR